MYASYYFVKLVTASLFITFYALIGANYYDLSYIYMCMKQDVRSKINDQSNSSESLRLLTGLA